MKHNRLLAEPEAMKALCEQFEGLRKLEGKPVTVPGLAVFLGFPSSRELLRAAENDPPDAASNELSVLYLQQAITKIEDTTLISAMKGDIQAQIGKHALSAYHKVYEKQDRADITDKTIEIHWISPPEGQNQTLIQNTVNIAALPSPEQKDRPRIVFSEPEKAPVQIEDLM